MSAVACQMCVFICHTAVPLDQSSFSHTASPGPHTQPADPGSNTHSELAQGPHTQPASYSRPHTQPAIPGPQTANYSRPSHTASYSRPSHTANYSRPSHTAS
ncbi:hypothetical protein BsWGS_19989 [Bradybaena similaris]